VLVSLSYKLVFMKRGSATALDAALATEPVNSEGCVVSATVPNRRAGHRVMRVVLAGGATPVAGSCYNFRVVTTDRRGYTGVMQVAASRLRNAPLR
jgi:hypothetical protein